MSKAIKAVRATIDLGGITLNVYQLPDGSYRLAGRNVTDAIGEPNNSLTREMGVKSLNDLPNAGLSLIQEPPKKGQKATGKSLPNAGLSLIQIKAETGESFIPVSIEDAATYWGIMASKANTQALAILVACASEAIERRADKTFDVGRSEKEYNERLKKRIEGIVVRRSLTDAVQSYIERHPELPDMSIKFMYSNASDKVNKAVFDRVARQLVKDFKCEDKNKLRDQFDQAELLHISQVEALAMRLIDQDDMEPVAAVDEARRRLLIPVSKRTV